jgi:thiol-disulfide isomerase/thioredoxin
MYADTHGGKYPDSLHDLVPEYVNNEAILVDSEHGKPFEYRGKDLDATASSSEILAFAASDSGAAVALLKSGIVTPMTRDQLTTTLARAPMPSGSAQNQPASKPSTTANLFTWADLANRPERWPAEVKLTVPLQFSGGTVRAGTTVRVYEVTANDASVITSQGLAFKLDPDECNLVEAANKFWSTLTPEQRAIDPATVANDATLWPDTVRTKLALTFDLAGGQTRQVPAGSQCTLAFYDGKIACASPVGESAHLEFKITDLDLIERARERALIDPAKRPSRIVQAIRALLTDNEGRPYIAPSLDEIKAFVFFYGANWCGYCHRFSPYLVKFANENLSPTWPVMFVLLDGDDRDTEMFAYMKSDKMPWSAIRKAAWQRTFLAPVPQGFPHLLITDRYGKVLYSDGGGGDSNIRQHLQALVKLRADVPGAKSSGTDVAADVTPTKLGSEPPPTAMTASSPRENPAASRPQTEVNPTEPAVQAANQPSAPAQLPPSASPTPVSQRSVSAQTADVKFLDPAAVVNDCMRTYRDARNVIHTQLNGTVFEQRYRGQHVKYSGIIEAVKKAEGTIVFKGTGHWPANYHVEANFAPDKWNDLETLQKGQRITVEANLAGFDLPQMDVAVLGVGPSRTITLGQAMTLNQ